MNLRQSILFTPFQLGPVSLRNRTIRAAAFEGMCPDNMPSDDLLNYHRTVAAGGMELEESLEVAEMLEQAGADALILIPLLMKLGVVKKPETVAKAGINALFNNRAECIPGLLNKLTVLLIPLIPHFIIGIINKRTNLIR